MSRWWGACGLALVSASFATARGDDSLRRRFESEYPAAGRKLREFYTNLRASGTERRGDDSSRWEFGGNGELMRSVVTHRDGSVSVIVASPEKAFTLEKGPGSNRFTVTALGPAPPHEYRELVQTIRKKSLAISSPHAILAESIGEFVSEKSFRCREAREVESDGIRVIRVEWENSPAGAVKRRGSFEFLADGSWALRSFDFHFPETKGRDGRLMDIGRHGVLEYQGQRDGMPLVRRMRLWNSGPAGNSPETVIEVAELSPGPVPRDRFTLEAFGVSTSPVAEPTPVAYYLLGLSALSALVVVAVRFLRGRQGLPSGVTGSRILGGHHA
jgi:hypothetical protein